MLRFKVGDRAAVRPDGRGPVQGMPTRGNRRTVTIVTNDGRQWNVAPAFVTEVGSRGPSTRAGLNVIALKA